MSDDIAMGALAGSIAARTRAAIAAGCDIVLHCNGKFDEMRGRCGGRPGVVRGAGASGRTARWRRGMTRIRSIRPPPARPSTSPGRAQHDHRDADSMSGDVTNDTASLKPSLRPMRPPSRLAMSRGWSSTSRASRARSICCWLLARQQKVDLAKISILALADQFLAFIEAARRLRLEIAADYLVMAAWLAYLKSRLLLPEHPAKAKARAPKKWPRHWPNGYGAWRRSGRSPKTVARPQLGAICSSAAILNRSRSSKSRCGRRRLRSSVSLRVTTAAAGARQCAGRQDVKSGLWRGARDA